MLTEIILKFQVTTDLLIKQMKNQNSSFVRHIYSYLKRICFSLHIGFSILESLRNNFESSYPDLLLYIFPFFHYPMYR